MSDGRAERRPLDLGDLLDFFRILRAVRPLLSKTLLMAAVVTLALGFFGAMDPDRPLLQTLRHGRQWPNAAAGFRDRVALAWQWGRSMGRTDWKDLVHEWPTQERLQAFGLSTEVLGPLEDNEADLLLALGGVLGLVWTLRWLRRGPRRGDGH